MLANAWPKSGDAMDTRVQNLARAQNLSGHVCGISPPPPPPAQVIFGLTVRWKTFATCTHRPPLAQMSGSRAGRAGLGPAGPRPQNSAPQHDAMWVAPVVPQIRTLWGPIGQTPFGRPGLGCTHAQANTDSAHQHCLDKQHVLRACVRGVGSSSGYR